MENVAGLAPSRKSRAHVMDKISAECRSVCDLASWRVTLEVRRSG